MTESNWVCYRANYEIVVPVGAPADVVSSEIYVVPGVIEIHGIDGKVQKEAINLVVDMAEKYVEVDIYEDEESIYVNLSVGERTLDKHLNPLTAHDPETGLPKQGTEIHFPRGWTIMASCAKTTCRIIGVRALCFDEGWEADAGGVADPQR